MTTEVTRYIKPAIQCVLWGKSAGRCEFSGCNKPLWKSSVTQEPVNIAQKAHIYSFSDDGPRGHETLDEDTLNDIENLMLVCHECHRTMDKAADGGRYNAELLCGWKATHEARIELATSIAPEKRSYVLLFGANIGAHTSPLRFVSTAPSLFPERYPAEERAIDLGMINSTWQDRDERFWRIEASNLRNQFQQKVRERLAVGAINHLSVFGLAPQPLLMLLGSLLTDIPTADVYQLRREPQGWGWSQSIEEVPFILNEPGNRSGVPALVLSLSASIIHDRITSVLGANASIWEVTVTLPHNDFLQTRGQLQAFRQMARPLLDRIKAAHGHGATLHVFPAAPVAIAVELGRIHMPKADLRLRIYDEVRDRGFVPALEIPGGELDD